MQDSKLANGQAMVLVTLSFPKVFIHSLNTSPSMRPNSSFQILLIPGLCFKWLSFLAQQGNLDIHTRNFCDLSYPICVRQEFITVAHNSHLTQIHEEQPSKCLSFWHTTTIRNHNWTIYDTLVNFTIMGINSRYRISVGEQ